MMMIGMLLCLYLLNSPSLTMYHSIPTHNFIGASLGSTQLCTLSRTMDILIGTGGIGVCYAFHNCFGKVLLYSLQSYNVLIVKVPLNTCAPLPFLKVFYVQGCAETLSIGGHQGWHEPLQTVGTLGCTTLKLLCDLVATSISKSC